eukprot:scaffold304574_cov33-Tisochrysis_lutea.AAC.1
MIEDQGVPIACATDSVYNFSTWYARHTRHMATCSYRDKRPFTMFYPTPTSMRGREKISLDREKVASQSVKRAQDVIKRLVAQVFCVRSPKSARALRSRSLPKRWSDAGRRNKYRPALLAPRAIWRALNHV